MLKTSEACGEKWTNLTQKESSRKQEQLLQPLRYVIFAPFYIITYDSFKAKFSPSANEDYPARLFDLACAQLKNCKDSIEENVTYAMTALGQVFNAVLSVFRPSGKERGPGIAYGDL